MKTLEFANVMSHEEIRPGIWSMWLKSPKIASMAKPGQFVHVRVRESYTPLLRRPISIGRIKSERIELVYRVVGKGTDILSQKKEGETVGLLGPLGTPFKIKPEIKCALLVGGGLGMPPMVCLNEAMKEKGIKTQLLLGIHDENGIPLKNEDPVFSETFVVSEVGDRGFRKGLVTELVQEKLVEMEKECGLGNVAVYTCGPWGLVGAMKRVVDPSKVAFAQVSLEQQMGCGIGVCQGCAVEVKGGPTPYKLVCHDGPVFNLFDVEVPHAC